MFRKNINLAKTLKQILKKLRRLKHKNKRQMALQEEKLSFNVHSFKTWLGSIRLEMNPRAFLGYIRSI